MKKIKLLLFVIAVFAIQSTSAQKKVAQFINHSDWSFIQNKGQIIDKSGRQISDVKYYGHQGGVYLYCRPGMISLAFTKTETDNNLQISEATGLSDSAGVGFHARARNGIGLKIERETARVKKISTSRMDLVLTNANPNSEILASDKQEYYENFYTGSSADHGIQNVHTYKIITYKDIYPNIDLVLIAKSGGLKYEFAVRPGGNINDIQLQWNGAMSIHPIQNGGISYASKLGEMEESKPVSFLSDGKNIETRFVLKNNNIHFSLNKYDHSKTLTIDPFLSWATYFGGSNNENGQVVATDASGNPYVTGYTTSISGIASSGAYQTIFKGNTDIYIAKYSSTGLLIWSTYYGGKNTEEAAGIAVDKNSNVLVTGYSFSDSGIATSGAYQTKLGGVADAIIAKFSSSGSLVWATYFGGENVAESNGIAIDGSGNIIITGNTDDSTAIASTGSYQKSIAGSNDAFIAKFSSSGSLTWSTYFGEKDDDRGHGVALDGSGNIFIVGYTNSSGLASSGVYQTSMNGVYDAFVAGFSSSGNLKWCSYFGGSGYDDGLAIATDGPGNVFIAGYTSSSGLASAGAFNTKFSGSPSNAFIAKFSSSGSRVWSTYYGGLGDDIIWSLAVDGFNNLIAGGSTSSTLGIASFGASQKSIASAFSNGNDAFLAKFSNSGSRIWATYYGGPSSDEGFGVALDKSGNAYLSGQTESATGMATKGAQQTNLAGGEDAFLAYFNLKFFADEAGIESILTPSVSNLNSFCMGSQAVKVEFTNYGTNEIDSLHIGWSVNGKVQPVYSWQGKLLPDSQTSATLGNFSFPQGTITVKAWTIKPNGGIDSVAPDDSAFFTATAILAPTPNAGGNHTICAGTPIAIGSTPISGYGYAWYTKPKGYKSNSGNPKVTPDTTTTYYLVEVVISTGCTVTDSAVITVRPPLPLNAGKNQAVCFGKTVSIGSAPVNGITYSWSSSPSGFTSASSTASVSPSATTTYYLTGTLSSTGCSKTDSVVITIYPLPDATWYSDYQGNTTYFYANDSNLKSTSYHWNFGDGDSTTGNPAKHLYPKNKAYFINLGITDSNGCINNYKSILNVAVSGIPMNTKNDYSLEVFPNPFRDMTYIGYELVKNSDIKILITDINGKQSRTIKEEKQMPGKYQLSIDGGQLQLLPGIYILKFITDDGEICTRLVKF